MESSSFESERKKCMPWAHDFSGPYLAAGFGTGIYYKECLKCGVHGKHKSTII